MDLVSGYLHHIRVAVPGVGHVLLVSHNLLRPHPHILLEHDDGILTDLTKVCDDHLQKHTFVFINYLEYEWMCLFINYLEYEWMCLNSHFVDKLFFLVVLSSSKIKFG